MFSALITTLLMWWISNLYYSSNGLARVVALLLYSVKLVTLSYKVVSRTEAMHTPKTSY